MTFDTVGLVSILFLMAVVGGACYYAGWRSAQSHLNAALAVSSQTNVIIAQSNSYSSSLDKQALEAQSLRASVDQCREDLSARQQRVESAVGALFEGFERAGLARSARPAPGRQVGETRQE